MKDPQLEMFLWKVDSLPNRKGGAVSSSFYRELGNILKEDEAHPERSEQEKRVIPHRKCLDLLH